MCSKANKYVQNLSLVTGVYMTQVFNGCLRVARQQACSELVSGCSGVPAPAGAAVGAGARAKRGAAVHHGGPLHGPAAAPAPPTAGRGEGAKHLHGSSPFCSSLMYLVAILVPTPWRGSKTSAWFITFCWSLVYLGFLLSAASTPVRKLKSP